MDTWLLLLDILVILAASAAAGLALEKFRQNAIVGYLLAGVVLGRAGLRVVESAKPIETIAELGVALLLFTIGLEFSWQRLRQLGSVALGGGTVQVVSTVLLTAAACRLAGLGVTEALVVGAAVALSSTAVVLRVLTDRTELESPHGRNALGMLLLQDVAVVPLILMLNVLGGEGGWEAVRRFAVTVLEGGALVLLVIVVTRHLLPRLLASVSSFRNRDLPVLLAFTVFLAATWASHAIGLSPVLGAFVAGMVLAETPFAEQIRADVTPFRALFVTVFFTSIGMLVEMPGLGTVAAAAGLAVLIIGGKAAVAAAAVKLFGRPWPQALRTGLVLGQIGEFSFVLSELGRRQGLIDEQSFQVLLGASLLTLLATPYLIALAARSAGRAGEGVRAGEEAAESGEGPGVVVVGFGPAGRTVVEALQQSGVPVLVLELNPRTVNVHRVALPIQIGDATQRDILEHAGVRRAEALVVTLPDPAAARLVVRQAKQLAPRVPVVVRARYHIYAASLQEAGADQIVDEEAFVGEELARRVLSLVERREREAGA